MEVKSKETPDKGIELYFEVSDSGIGIPQDKVPLLFKAFSQLDASTTRQFGGTGLGLAICQRLVKLMDGTIGVRSKVGVGSTFYFSSKMVIADQEPSSPLVLISFPAKKVLLADDNLTNLQVLRQQFKEWNLQVVVVSSGNQVLDFLKSEGNSLDALITDISLADMNGIELAKFVKQHYTHLPIILINFFGDENNKKHANLFDAVITKPIKQQQLAQALRVQLSTVLTDNFLEEAEPSILRPDFACKHPLKILVAEDNPVNQKLIKKVLNELGYEPQVVVNGAEALEKHYQESFDLILMDVVMPELDGLEATRIIRKRQYTQAYIVAMTANAMPEDKDDCLNAGMNDYLAKPINLQELIRVIEKASKEISKTR